MLFLFFKTLTLLMYIEAYSISCTNNLSKEVTNYENIEEINSLLKEVKNSQESVSDENKIRSIQAILLIVKRFKHLRCCSKIIEDRVLMNKDEAIQFYRRHYRILMVFVIVIPILFLIKAIYDHLGYDSNLPNVIINLIKGLTTGYCMYGLIFFVKNLEEIFHEYSLLSKFFCVKIIILFFILQTIILNFIKPTTDSHNSEEMAQIINFFLLNVENCFLGLLWTATYGYHKMGVEKYRNLLVKNSSSNNNDKNTSEVMGLHQNAVINENHQKENQKL